MATQTAAQRRAEAKRKYNAYIAECPTRQLLDAISDKWVSLILTALADSPARYGELSRTIAGVTQKMLTQTLRRLERDGLLTRTVTPDVPVQVEYRLTPLGTSLLPVMRALQDWAEDHMDEVLQARREHTDAASTADVADVAGVGQRQPARTAA